MAIAAPAKPTGSITTETLTNALISERDHVSKGLTFAVSLARQDREYIIVDIAAAKGRRSSAIDEGLEGARAVWGENLEFRGEVFFVDAENAKLVIRYGPSTLPEADSLLRIYPRDFLTPLIDLWQDAGHRQKAVSLAAAKELSPGLPEKPLRSVFSELRTRQIEAVSSSLHERALLIGPPGTGKTYTIGAIAANLLTRFKNSRILLLGPTNVAVDTALISADDWLTRMGKLSGDAATIAMKRAGSRFDPRKYKDRPHLLDTGVHEASVRLTILELEEPSKTNVERYSSWKTAVERARKELKADLRELAVSSRLLALTTASAFIFYDDLVESDRWDFVICDEASQISLPAALMVGRLGKRVLFAGDPHQLSPVVQCEERQAQSLLSKTAFQSFPGSVRIQLNEQSRMCEEICNAVAKTFYEGDLLVCKKAKGASGWIKERSPWFIDGREVPRLYFESIDDEAKWSQQYNGFIRFRSARAVADVVAAFLGSYAGPEELLVLTPFRAQRALLRQMMKKGNANSVKVSTVHRSQGTENKIVIFDPVDAGGSFLNSDNGRRLINVAISRAQSHCVVLANKPDLSNRWLRSIYESAQNSLKKDGYGRPFAISR